MSMGVVKLAAEEAGAAEVDLIMRKRARRGTSENMAMLLMRRKSNNCTWVVGRDSDYLYSFETADRKTRNGQNTKSEWENVVQYPRNPRRVNTMASLQQIPRPNNAVVG